MASSRALEEQTVYIAGVDWSLGGRPFVLALSSRCTFCIINLDFHQSLLNTMATTREPAQFIAVPSRYEEALSCFSASQRPPVLLIAKRSSATFRLKATPNRNSS